MARPDFLTEGFGTVARAGFEEVWVPAPVSMAPETVGWWVVLGICISALGYLVFRRVRRYRANAYRREALKTLNDLRHAFASDKSRAEALPILLKRAALGGYPRRRVAGLTGERWGAFLIETGSDAFTAETATSLHTLSYQGGERLSANDIAAVADAIESWIRRHRAAV